MRTFIPEIHQSGAELVIIGNGKPHHADAFRADLKLETPLYVDPKMGTYRALNLKYGIWRTFDPLSLKGWMTALTAFRAGFRNKKVTGDPWQQGGLFLVMPNGQVPYHYISKNAGDLPPVDDVMAALRTAVKQA